MLKKEDINFISNIKIEDIPWNKLESTYGDDDISKLLKNLKIAKIDDIEEISGVLCNELEHQDSIWQSTPLAVIFILRMIDETYDEIKNTNSKRHEPLVYSLLYICEIVLSAAEYGISELIGDDYNREVLIKDKDGYMQSSILIQDMINTENNVYELQCYYSYHLVEMYQNIIKELMNYQDGEIRSLAKKINDTLLRLTSIKW